MGGTEGLKCGDCGMRIEDDRRLKAFAMLKRCGVMVKAVYCDKCFPEHRRKMDKPPKRKGFAISGRWSD